MLKEILVIMGAFIGVIILIILLKRREEKFKYERRD